MFFSQPGKKKIFFFRPQGEVFLVIPLFQHIGNCFIYALFAMYFLKLQGDEIELTFYTTFAEILYLCRSVELIDLLMPQDTMGIYT